MSLTPKLLHVTKLVREKYARVSALPDLDTAAGGLNYKKSIRLFRRI